MDVIKSILWFNSICFRLTQTSHHGREAFAKTSGLDMAAIASRAADGRALSCIWSEGKVIFTIGPVFLSTVGSGYNSFIGTWNIWLLYQVCCFKEVKSNIYVSIGIEYFDCYIRFTFISVAVMTGNHCIIIMCCWETRSRRDNYAS